MKRRMRSNRNSGFTLVEMLATVGILVILLAVSAVAVTSYVDELKIAELDNAAREIYMAAENRAVLLSVAERMDDLMTESIVTTDTEGNVIATRSQRQRGESAVLSNVPTCVDEKLRHTDGEKLYFVSAADLGDDLLTYGAIDRTLLDKGYFYIVYKLYTYDDDSNEFTGGGSVTDVFYAEEPLDFAELVKDLEGVTGSDFEKFYSKWADTRSNRVALKRTNRKPLVGWYNGKADGGGVHDLETSYINVNIENEEMLTVTVSYNYITYDDSPAATLKVLLSDGENTITLSDPQYDERKVKVVGENIEHSQRWPDSDSKTRMHSYTCTWVLDSLMGNREDSETVGQPLQFKDLVDGTGFTPGSDFKVVATLTPNEGVHLDEVFDEDVNNSLFQEGSGGATAYIKNLRHLQNLDTEIYASGVTGKTAAVQTGQILGSGNDSVKNSEGNTVDIYSGYNFVPILNIDITEYDGRNNEILNLNVNYNGYKKVTVEEDDESGENRTVTKIVPAGSVNEDDVITQTAVIDSAGLFKAADNMTLSNIRLVNTTVTVEAGEFVGALAGQTADTTISNCWVYWDEEHVKNPADTDPVLGNELGSDETESGYIYQLIGKTVGGLVGQADGNTKIEKSLAATLIRGTSNAGSVGGLVGQTASGSTTTISTSYADCYLTGKGNVAGLVGNAAGTVTLENCYAAGFIIVDENHTNNAGLCLGTGDEKNINTTNVYSAMVRPGTDGTPNSVPYVPLVDQQHKDEFSNCYYLGQGKTMNDDAFVSKMNTGMSSVFEKKISKTDTTDAVNKKRTYPYYLEKYLRDLKAEEEEDVAYEYPGLKNLPHYGDWGEEPPAKPLALVYYEEYEVTDDTNVTTSYGVSGYKVNERVPDNSNMKEDEKDGKTIVKDGYAVAFSKADITNDSTETVNNVRIEYYDSEGKIRTTEAGVSLMFTYIVPGSSSDSSSNPRLTVWGKSGDDEHYLIPLPDELVIDAAASDDFYMYLKFMLYDAGDANTPLGVGEYYFNPHFANMVQPNEEGGFVSEPKSDAIPKAIDIRTPRHLYHLSQYPEYSNNGVTFNQVFDLNYGTYGGYDSLVKDSSTRGRQGAIGTVSNSFNGTYDGQGNEIKGLKIDKTNTNAEAGLFGYSNGNIYNVILASDCEIRGNNNVGGIVGYNTGNVQNCINRSTTVAGSDNVGGIVGYNTGNVQNCTNHSTVTGDNKVGGIAGCNTNKVLTTSEWVNTGDITGKIYVGGLVGYNDGGTVDGGLSRNNRGTVNGTGNDNESNVGGFVGYNKGGTVKNCIAVSTQTVTGSYNNIDGIVGKNDNGTVESCINESTIAVASVYANNVGGIVGLNSSTEAAPKAKDLEVVLKPATTDDKNTVNNLKKRADGIIDGLWDITGGLVKVSYNTGTVASLAYGVGGLDGQLDR